MVQHPMQAEKLVGPVVVEVRFDNLLAIQRIVLVELDDPLDQRGLVSKIEVIEKTLRIEFAVDQGIAPINRQAPRRHGLTIFSVVYPGSEAFSKAMLNLYRFKNSILPHGPPGTRYPMLLNARPPASTFL